MNQVHFVIDCIPENSAKIASIQKILMATLLPKDDVTSDEPADKPAKDAPTLAQVKAATKKAKADHGEDFCQSSVERVGGEVKPTLGKSISALDDSAYAEFMEGLAAGPAEDDDGLGDDGLGDEPEEAEISADTVKTALKAYSKEVSKDAARKIMKDNNAATLAKVDECSKAQLAAMMNAMQEV